jgi:hypothetical protein
MNIIELDRRLAIEFDLHAPFGAIEAMCEHASADYLVWWGCLCSWSTWRPIPPPSEDLSLSIASRWVFTRDNTILQEAAIRSEMADASSFKWLLQAIAHSGGSIAVNGHETKMSTSDTAGRFVLGFIHQLLSIHSTVNRSAAAQTFVQFARQALTEPLPRLTTSFRSPTDHD